MEDQYADEARSAEDRGDFRRAADLYLLSVQAATNKLSDTRIQSFMFYSWSFVLRDGPGYVSAEDEDLKMLLYSFLNNPDEPTVVRAQAASVMGHVYRFGEGGSTRC